MKTKKKLLLFVLTLIGTTQIFLYSCRKEEKLILPSTNILILRVLSSDSALIDAVVYDDGNVDVTVRGIVWSSFENPTIEDNDGSADNGEGIGTFYNIIKNLKPDTKYYVKVYFKSILGTTYGKQFEFTTLDGKTIIATKTCTNITAYSVKTGGIISSDGGASVTERGIVWGKSEYPSIDVNDGYTSDGDGIGEFESKISGLLPQTTYFVRTYATNSVSTQYGNQLSFTTTPADGATGTISYNDYTYKTVYIAGREWMAENLHTTKFNDGTSITLVTDNGTWANLSNSAYCWYKNDQSTYGNTYGALYNGYTLNSDKLCPIGWHVPTNAEWADLVDYVGGASIASAKLKATAGWYFNLGGTDDYGFSALPGGDRYFYNGEFNNVLSNGSWWTSTKDSEQHSMYWSMSYGVDGISNSSDNDRYGYSIRCIKDL